MASAGASPAPALLFYLAVASLVMPSLLVGFGIGLGFRLFDWSRTSSPPRSAAQLTWTLPFGLFAMFAVFNRFNRTYEEAATDLGATRLAAAALGDLPILMPGIIGVAMGAFTLSYDEYARTTLVAGNRNTLPLEIYALISSATSPTLFAIGTLTTARVLPGHRRHADVVLRMQRRRAVRPAGLRIDRMDTSGSAWTRASMSSWCRSPSAMARRSRWMASRCASRRPAIAACSGPAAAARPARCA